MVSGVPEGPGRRKNRRRIGYRPRADFFKPRGIPMTDLEEVEMTMEELESLRLVDLLGLDRDSAAERMGISRKSLSNDLTSARKKVADALVNSRALMIGGGSYSLGSSESVPVLESSKGDGMKIAIPADGNTMGSGVDRRFARCPYYMIMETENDETRFVENRAAEAGGGAGITAAQSLIDLGVNVVISGNLGPKAHQILKGAGMEIYLVEGVSVKEALEMYDSEKLKRIDSPNVAGHHGMN